MKIFFKTRVRLFEVLLYRIVFCIFEIETAIHAFAEPCFKSVATSVNRVLGPGHSNMRFLGDKWPGINKSGFARVVRSFQAWSHTIVFILAGRVELFSCRLPDRRPFSFGLFAWQVCIPVQNSQQQFANPSTHRCSARTL